MATAKGRPRGAFDYLLAMDCETTGLCMNQHSPVFNPTTGERHQTVSWGLIVADAETLKPIDTMYVEVKWNKTSLKQRLDNPQWGTHAENIHGLSLDYLDQNGVSEQQAVEQMGELVLKHWGPKGNIRTLGHNVMTFDLPFFRDIFERHGITLAFGNRHYCTNSIGFATFGTFTSDALFEAVGFEKRGEHNALTDAGQALEATRRIRTIFQKAIQ